MENSVGAQLKHLAGPVLITGHTGFKGTWMTLLLEHFGVQTVGFSLDPLKDSLYTRANRRGVIPEKFKDVRQYIELKSFINDHNPSVILHMAAQPLVLESYKRPRETFDINVMGTVNILDLALRESSVKVVVVVSTDKVYENRNLSRKFQESDPLLGKDPYSASKVAKENAVTAWQQLVNVNGGPKIVSVRAGNVIGGGDLASSRLIPDIVRSYIFGNKLLIRNASSTRPWQHVLDPLIGYIRLVEKLLEGNSITNVNFGPIEKSLSVGEVVEISSGVINFEFEKIKENSSLKKLESQTLELDPSYAGRVLNWYPKFDQVTAINRTLEWWVDVLDRNVNPLDACKKDIEKYFSK
jgi:CDP-glucose 4,6-dehydratase